MRKSIQRVVMAAAGLLALSTATPAHAATTGVLASYNGGVINLAEGWGEADVCSEDENGVVCHDLPQGGFSVMGTISDCRPTYACLWQHSGAEGKRLEWKTKGSRDLADYGFRDKATGAMNNRALFGFELTDVRTGLPDPQMYIGVGQYVNLKNESYPYGGNWNDKVDKVKLL